MGDHDADRFKVHNANRWGNRKPVDWTSSLRPFTTGAVQRSLVFRSGIQGCGCCVESMHSIPLAHPLLLPERQLAIDPYLLGLWLGDGDSIQAMITCHWDDEPHYRRLAVAAGENWRIGGSADRRRPYVLRYTLSGEPPPPPTDEPGPRFLTRLRELGVKGNKHVPPEYLRAGR